MSVSAAAKVMKFRVGLCQMLVSGNKQANLLKAKTMITSAVSQGAELVILPECFNSTYNTKLFRQNAEEIPDCVSKVDPVKSPSVAMLVEEAKRHHITLIGGSIPEYCNDRIYNTAMVMSWKSDRITKHRKMHLFDVNIPGGICFQESETLTAGDSFTVFPYSSVSANLNIGLGVCYDMRFPELSLVYGQKGCKMLVFPSAFNMTTGPLHWDILAKGRAVDNQSFVILCSPARDEKGSYVAYGHSVIVSPWGKVIGQLDEKEGILVADIDLKECDSVRAAIPVKDQKRYDLYDLTTSKSFFMGRLLELDLNGRKAYAFQQLRDVPEWKDVVSIDDFDMEQNKEGLTNVIYKLSKKSNPDDFPILFRIYGEGSNEFLNREKEIQFFSIISKNHLGIRLIKQFPEGRMEEWKVGYTSLSSSGCRDPAISKQIAEKLADMHNMPIDPSHFEEYSDMLYSWVAVCENHFDPSDFNNLDLSLLKEEIRSNDELIRNESSDIVYGHQDLLRGNVLRNKEGDILIIDYEYTCLLSAPLDICHHWCEWMTRYDSDSYWLDLSRHPTKEEEEHFISAYLARRRGRVVSEEEVAEFCNTVHRLQCFSFFLWFVWAVMQTFLKADWDCKGYALSRWKLYKGLKQKYYGVDCPPILQDN